MEARMPVRWMIAVAGVVAIVATTGFTAGCAQDQPDYMRHQPAPVQQQRGQWSPQAQPPARQGPQAQPQLEGDAGPQRQNQPAWPAN